ncbi:hypothetical protein BKA80DRAFT_303469 [Phyllosticta citrichinensis]
MLNLNIAPRTAESFLPSGLKVHAGFLGAAQALEPRVSNSITEASRETAYDTSSSRGILPVLQLLLFFFCTTAKRRIVLSCILFGCPPAFRPSLPALHEVLKPAAGELWLNIINEYDVISRADRPYFRSLVDLFRSGYGKTPLDSKSCGSIFTDGSSTGVESILTWDVSLPEYRHHGDLTVFRMSRSGPSPAGSRMLVDDALRFKV